MNQLLQNSAYFGVAISLCAYAAGLAVKKRFKKDFLNPLLLASLMIIAVLLIFKIDYESYNYSAKYITYFLTPATVCFAVPLYRQLVMLKKHWKPVLIGVFAGVLASMGSILALSYIFGLTHGQYVSLLPKSVTTAIGIGIAEELDGLPSLTVAAIVITGLFGNIAAPSVCRLFRIKEPIAVGLAIGASSHAIGTVKAMELGEIQGAMSSLAITVAGLMTVGTASVFANFL